MKILVLGIGNDILCDDGTGPAVIRELKNFSCPPGVYLETTSLSGIPLLDIVTGYDILIIVDAIISGGKPGKIKWAQIKDFQSLAYSPSQHRMDICRVLDIGVQLGIHVPADVRILTIEAQDVTSFGEYLTLEVAAAVPEAAAEIRRQIKIKNEECRLAGLCRKVSGKPAA